MTTKTVNRFVSLMCLMGILACVPVFTTVTGCKTSISSIAYQSLFALGKTVNAAHDTYLDKVFNGSVGTNDFRTIESAYGQFQRVFNAAVIVAQAAGNNTTNTASPPNVATSGTNVLTLIQNAK